MKGVGFFTKKYMYLRANHKCINKKTCDQWSVSLQYILQIFRKNFLFFQFQTFDFRKFT